MFGKIICICLIYFVIGIFIYLLPGFEWTDELSLDEDTLVISKILFWPLYLLFGILRVIFHIFVLLFRTIKSLFKSVLE